MLKLKQVEYLFSDWAPDFQPRVALVIGEGQFLQYETEDLGLLCEVLGYGDYEVVAIGAEYEDTTILIRKP